MANPSVNLGADPPPVLPNTGTEVRIETWMQDPTQLWLLVTTRWPALNLPIQALPPEIRKQVPGPMVQANLKAESPRRYLKEAYDFVGKNVIPFLRATAE